MFILRDLLLALQAPFASTKLARERSLWFIFTLLAVIVPFTSSMSSNLLRSLQTLFGLDLGQRRFYTFMASTKIPWMRLWQVLWARIPEPTVEGRLLVALDDSINNKSGRKIFGCGFFHDHTAKLNQSIPLGAKYCFHGESIGSDSIDISSSTPVAAQAACKTDLPG